MANDADLILNIIDSSDAFIYLKDGEGRFLMVNSTFEKMFKLSREEIVGMTDYDLFPKEQAETFRAHDRKVAEAGTPMNFKGSVDLHDGQITVIDHKFPVSVEGSPNAVGGISIYITESE